MLCYCKKCGGIISRLSKNIDKPCNYCQSQIYKVPKEYTLEGLETCLDNDLKDQFINEYIKSSPEFDQFLFEHREQDMFNKRMVDKAKLEHGKAVLEGKDKGNPYGMTCPYCHATNIKKISVARRMISTSLFGLASSKIGKTYKCSKCGSTW